MVVGHRVVVLLQVLRTSPCRGGAAQNYNLHCYVHFFQKLATFLRHLVLAASGQQGEAYSILFPYDVVDHETLLGVSRSEEIRLEICRTLHIYGCICSELSTFFGQPVDA